jgi:hypothetical protein
MEKIAERMLLDVFRAWPSGRSAKFLITPGGYLSSKLPENLSGRAGWNSCGGDFSSICQAAEKSIAEVVTDRVCKAADGKAESLTIGIDLSGNSLRAELVAVIDLADGRILSWTGKSYPTSAEEKELIQVVDLNSHCLEFSNERVLVLGCHDLNMFSPRAWNNQSESGVRRSRCASMRKIARNFKPTVILQHPHRTDSENIWRTAWSGVKTMFGAHLHDWASGICYDCLEGPRRRPLENVLDGTRYQDPFEFIFETGGGVVSGPKLRL